METRIEGILEFHKLYNDIYDEQIQLPARKGKKDYSDIENRVKDLARELIYKIRTFKMKLSSKDDDCICEVDNIISGCEKIIQNPYNKIGGKVSLKR